MNITQPLLIIMGKKYFGKNVFKQTFGLWYVILEVELSLQNQGNKGRCQSSLSESSLPSTKSHRPLGGSVSHL